MFSSKPTTMGLLLIALLTHRTAMASSGAATQQSDVQQLRADAASRVGAVNRGVSAYDAELATGEDTLGFTLTSLAPGYFNSNAEQLDSGGTQSFEANPEVRLVWQKQFSGSIAVSALVDINSDRYTSASDANADTTFAKFRVQHVTGKDDQEFQPFVEYSPRLNFEPFFKKNNSTAHDFRLGTDKVFNFDGKLHQKSDASGTTVWTLSIEADVLRRQTNSGSSSTRVEIEPNLTWYKSSDWNMSIEVDAIPTRFDSSKTGSRNLTASTAIFTCEYAPMSWVSANKRRALKVDFQIVYARADANDSTLKFQQWSLGPMLKGALSF